MQPYELDRPRVLRRQMQPASRRLPFLPVYDPRGEQQPQQPPVDIAAAFGAPRELKLPQSPMQQVMAPQAQAIAPQGMPGTPQSVAPPQQQPRMSPEELSRVLGAGAAAIGQFAGPGGGGVQNMGAAIASLAGGMGQGRQQFAQEQTEREMLDFQRAQIERKAAVEQQETLAAAQQKAEIERIVGEMPDEFQQLYRMDPEAFSKKIIEQRFPDPQEPTATQRHLADMGLQPGTPEYQQALRDYMFKPQSVSNTTVNVPPTPFESEYDKTRGKSMAENAGAIQAAGAAAEEQLASIGPLMASLANEDVYQGTGGTAVNSLKRFGRTMLGLDFEGVGDAEVVQTIGNQMALSLRTMMPGPMSDGDRRFLQSLPPNLTNSREGNILVGEFFRRSAERAVERANAAREYEARTGRLDPGFDREWAEYMRNNPVFNEEDYAATQEAARGATQPTPLAGVPDDITDILGRYGVGN